MKRFSLITEADARVLEPGSTVELAPGGHVTPLARDTLKARRVTLVDARGADADLVEDVGLRAEVRTLGVGSDHEGVALKRALVRALRARGLAVQDLGTDDTEAVDYPDIAAAVARLVARGEVDAGLVIDATGIGSAIAANKVTGIRAATATDEASAREARERSGVNVLALGSTLVSVEEARAILEIWLEARVPGPRDVRQLGQDQEARREGTLEPRTSSRATHPATESTGSRKEALAVLGCVKSGRLAHGWSFLPGPAIYARPAVPGQAPIDARSSLALGAAWGSEMLPAPVRLLSSVGLRPSVAPPAAFTRVRWVVGPGRTRLSRSGLVCVARLAVLVCRPVHASLPPVRVMLRGSALGSNPSSSRPLGSVDAWRKRAPCQAVRAARLAPRAVWCTFLLVAGLTDFEREGARVKGPSTSRASRRVSIHRRRTRKLLRGSNTQSCAIL